MLKKRIIPCLDIKDGRTVKGTKFKDLIDAGDPVLLAGRYAEEGADELVFLDISASEEKRKTLTKLVSCISQEINIPFTVGGGIRSVEDAHSVINAGADKISVNTSAVLRPALIKELASEFGSQCIVVAVDTQFTSGQWVVVIYGGKTQSRRELSDWVQTLADLGAGELLLTAIDRDGTKQGFALDLLEDISNQINIPVIASGGAGCAEHFSQLFERTRVSAALAAGVFHTQTLSIEAIKSHLKSKNIPIR